MATRTLNQNNFYFAFITDIHKQALEKHITVQNMDYMRNGLKEIDENYPKELINHWINPDFKRNFNQEVFDNHVKEHGKPISSAKLTTKQMTDHIEFIIHFVAEFGITPQFVEDEWKRLLELAHA